jgi:steroid delta-isomerase-like uncharacterized protein
MSGLISRARSLAVALVLAASACQRPAAPEAGITPVAATAIVDGYLAAWNAHDAARAAGYMAEDVVYYDATVGTPQVSRDSALKNVIQAFITAAPDLKWVRDSSPPITGGDGIAFEWTFSGTHTGPFADGTKPTGRPFSFRGTTVIRLKEGRIAYQGDYYDAYGFLKQLGLVS